MMFPGQCLHSHDVSRTVPTFIWCFQDSAYIHMMFPGQCLHSHDVSRTVPTFTWCFQDSAYIHMMFPGQCQHSHDVSRTVPTFIWCFQDSAYIHMMFPGQWFLYIELTKMSGFAHQIGYQFDLASFHLSWWTNGGPSRGGPGYPVTLLNRLMLPCYLKIVHNVTYK